MSNLKDLKRMYEVIKKNPYISNKELRNVVDYSDYDSHELRKTLCKKGYLRRKYDEENKRYFEVIRDIGNLVDCSECQECYIHPVLWGEFWCKLKNCEVYDAYSIEYRFKDECSDFKKKTKHQ